MFIQKYVKPLLLTFLLISSFKSSIGSDGTLPFGKAVLTTPSNQVAKPKLTITLDQVSTITPTTSSLTCIDHADSTQRAALGTITVDFVVYNLVMVCGSESTGEFIGINGHTVLQISGEFIERDHRTFLTGLLYTPDHTPTSIVVELDRNSIK